MEKETKRDVISEAIKNIKLSDAGYVRKKSEGLCCSSEQSENGKIYPYVYLNAEQAPGLVGYDTSDKVTVVMECEITSHSSNNNKSGKKEEFTLEIKKIGCYKK